MKIKIVLKKKEKKTSPLLKEFLSDSDNYKAALNSYISANKLQTPEQKLYIITDSKLASMLLIDEGSVHRIQKIHEAAEKLL